MTTAFITNIFQVLASWDALCEVLYVHDFISHLALISKKMSYDQHLIQNALTCKWLLVGGFHLTTLVNKFHVAIWINGFPVDGNSAIHMRKHLHIFSLFFLVSSRKRNSGWGRGEGGRRAKITAFGEGGRMVFI